MHGGQEPVGGCNTCWLALVIWPCDMPKGWPSRAQRLQHLAPDMELQARRRARGALARLMSGGRELEHVPKSHGVWNAWVKGGATGLCRDRATRRLAPEDAVTPPPATGAPAGPFMPPQTAPRSPVCPAAPCTGSCARCLAIGRPSTRRGRLQPRPSGGYDACLRTSRSAPIPRGRADA